MKEPHRSLTELAASSSLVRSFTKLVLPIVFPYSTAIQTPNNEPTNKKLTQNSEGHVLIAIHPSKGDPPRLMLNIIKDQIPGNGKLLIPEAVHQYRGWHNSVGNKFSIYVCPITTEDTVKYVAKHPEKEAKFTEALTRKGAAELLANYLTKAIDTLSEGGTVLVFPQGGRRPFLDLDPQRNTNAVSTLINRSNRAQVDNFTVTCIGFDIDGVEDYSTVTGFNPRKTYRFLYGETLEKTELIRRAQQEEISIDQFVLNQLKELVPPNYQPRNI